MICFPLSLAVFLVCHSICLCFDYSHRFRRQVVSGKNLPDVQSLEYLHPSICKLTIYGASVIFWALIAQNTKVWGCEHPVFIYALPVLGDYHLEHLDDSADHFCVTLHGLSLSLSHKRLPSHISLHGTHAKVLIRVHL
jgi:hypothetical protein